MAYIDLTRVGAVGFAAVLVASLLPPADSDCVTLGRLIEGVVYINCPDDIDCTGQFDLCDFDHTQIGSDYYHFCSCGGGMPSCQGYLKSQNEDPEEGGDPEDVSCLIPATCSGNLHCDEAQLSPAESWVQICECKPK